MRRVSVPVCLWALLLTAIGTSCSNTSGEPALTLEGLRSKAPLCGWPTELPFVKEKSDYFGGKQNRAEILTARWEQMDKSAVAGWLSVLEGLGVPASGKQVFFGLGDASSLYQGGKLNRGLHARSLARLKSIPKAECQLWRDAISRSASDTEDPFWFALPLSLADALYDGKDNYSVAAASKYRARLKSVGPEETALWVRQLPAYAHWECDAVLSILLTEGFFKGDKLDKAAFAKALADPK